MVFVMLDRGWGLLVGRTCNDTRSGTSLPFKALRTLGDWHVQCFVTHFFFLFFLVWPGFMVRYRYNFSWSSFWQDKSVYLMGFLYTALGIFRWLAILVPRSFRLPTFPLNSALVAGDFWELFLSSTGEFYCVLFGSDGSARCIWPALRHCLSEEDLRSCAFRVFPQRSSHSIIRSRFLCFSSGSIRFASFGWRWIHGTIYVRPIYARLTVIAADSERRLERDRVDWQVTGR